MKTSKVNSAIMLIRLSRELTEDERCSLEYIMLADNDGAGYPVIFMDVEITASSRRRLLYRMSHLDSSEVTHLPIGKEYSAHSVSFSIDTEDEDLTIEEIEFFDISTDDKDVRINTYGCEIYTDGI